MKARSRTPVIMWLQRGLHSVGYQRGRFVIDAARPHIGEHQLHYFQSRVLQALSGQS